MQYPQLTLFDLDNTLLGDDSDHLWGEFLIEQGLVNPEQHKAKNDGFYHDYCQGTLDIDAYLNFVMQTVANKTVKEVDKLHNDFMENFIKPIMLPKAKTLIEQHQSDNHLCIIITATSDFITRPIANALGIDILLASEAEIDNNCYTGKPTGIPCFSNGKIIKIKNWLNENLPDFSTEKMMQEAFFYSDSRNDIPLLESVGKAIAVDPDETLKLHAQENDWEIISLR